MIRDNLIEHISGGNHELFHSNVLAYIARNHPDLFVDLFPEVKEELNGFERDDVEREKKNLDLSIRNKNFKKKGQDSEEDEFLLVLENKMKSFPNMEQLQKYNETCKSKAYILLSLLPSNEDVINRIGWKLVTYDDLAERLRGLTERNPYQIDGFFHTFLTYYVEYIESLSKKVREIKKEFDSSLTSVKIKDYLESNENDNKDLPDWQKLFIRKIRFQLVAELIKEKSKGDKLICNSGVVRGWIPFIELIPYTRDELNKAPYNYWVQIYDDHIERGFTIRYESISDGEKLKKERPGKRIQKKRQEFFDKIWKACMEKPLLKEIADILDTKFDLSSFRIKDEANQPEFRGYIYENNAMIDLHSDLPDLTIDKFVDSMVLEMKEIRSLIEKEIIIS